MPLITVCLPTYNRAKHLPNAINSILAQTGVELELLIWDDCSTDQTQDVVAGYHDLRIQAFRGDTNLGIPRVLNELLRRATGEYVVILHDHDIFAADLLSSMADVLSQHPNVGFVNPGVAWTDEEDIHRVEMDRLPGEVVAGRKFVDSMLTSSTFSCPITACAMVRQKAYKSVGSAYLDQYGFLSDVDMWLRLGMQWDVGQVMKTTLVCRERPADHTYQATDWRFLAWTDRIFRDNIDRFYTGNPARKNLRRHVSKLRRSYLRNLVSVAVDRPEKELLGSSEALQSSSDRVLQMLGKALSMDVARKFFRFVAQKIIGRRRGR